MNPLLSPCYPALGKIVNLLWSHVTHCYPALGNILKLKSTTLKLKIDSNAKFEAEMDHCEPPVVPMLPGAG